MIASWFVAGALAAAAGKGDVGRDGEIAWLHDLAAGEAQAQRDAKLLFVVFRCER